MAQHFDALSRRGFLQTGAALGATTGASATATQPHINWSFSPASKPRRISENLFVLEDTCNVYVIRSGGRGLAIDFGSGAILQHLPELGISSLDWILHTHHHRDQAQGDSLAVERRIPIAVPIQEREYFDDVERFWQNRRIFELYYVRNDFFSLTKNVPVSAVLHDYETFQWKGHDFFIQPTPGHTPGSITLITNIDGRKVAFSGDLMQSAGKVQTLYDLQYFYGEHEGADLSAYSLTELKKHHIETLCPSHGDVSDNPEPGMHELIEKLSGWFAYWKSWSGSLDHKGRQLTQHVIAHYQTMSSFYTVISDTGKALLIDYGLPGWNAFYTFRDSTTTYNRLRFLEHSIADMRAQYGLKSVEVAIASHMHDDHLGGFPYLSRRYGTKLWIFENFADIVSNPRGRNLGCTLGEALQVDRVIQNRETFRWEEFEFTAVHSPGHTDYQMALFSTIDGVKIGFTGDAFFHDADRPFEIRHNLIFRNRVNVGDHLKSIDNLLEFRPQILCPGHGEPFLLDMNMVADFRTKVMKQDEFCRSLIADPDTDVGMDPSAIEIFPYQSLVTPGESCHYELRARNHRKRAVALKIRLILPDGWTSQPAITTLNVAALSEGRSPVEIKVPHITRTPQHRIAIAADVLVDGRYLGQIAEAVVEIQNVGHENAT